MSDDPFDARIRAGDLPPVPEAGAADALAQIADRLAAAMNARPVNISVNIAAPEPPSFRRSEAYLAGQIARAVARGQRTQ